MPALEMETFNEIKDLMGDSFSTLVESYLEDMTRSLDNIEQNSTAEIAEISHSITSSSRQLGITKISDISKQIEIVARSNTDTNNIPHLIQSLKEEFEKAQKFLNDFTNK